MSEDHARSFSTEPLAGYATTDITVLRGRGDGGYISIVMNRSQP